MAFINGIGLISPQNTLEKGEFLAPLVEHHADFLKCIEPVYKNYINPILSRRMSRLIKMGISAAKICQEETEGIQPDAIITGTGLGSVEDTEKILGEITKEEKFLNPTPFIQSTYNTISSQIAIILKCHGYNSTYVHRAFSFESVLQDAMMQLEEGSADHVLAGGIDEMTMNHLQITRRIGLWKMTAFSNLRLLLEPGPGALPGEGAAYFMLSKTQKSSAYAKLAGVETIYKPLDQDQLHQQTKNFLSQLSLTPDKIDLVITGINGDTNWDYVYHDFLMRLFPGKPAAWFKHLCGEYHTATGFGLFVAAHVLKRQVFPEILAFNDIRPEKMKNILLYNHFRNVNHSLLLIQAVA